MPERIGVRILCDLCVKLSTICQMHKYILKASFLFIIIQVFSSTLKSQDEPYYSTKYVRNDNMVYRDNIRTVLMYKLGFELSPPIIQLYTTEKLVFTFDDL